MSTCYYGDARQRSRHPLETDELENELPIMHSVGAEDVHSMRVAASRETGYTRVSILFHLHFLYGFDVIKDLVFDAMHNLPLNIARQHLRRYSEEKLVDFEEVEHRLQNVPWTAGQLHVYMSCACVSDSSGIYTLVHLSCLYNYSCLVPAQLKAGRVPNHISSRMRYWAAEEYKKFAFPASPGILRDILPKEDYRIWFLLHKMVFHRGRYV